MKWLIKEYEVWLSKYPGARETDELINKGFIILNKPKGITSRSACNKIREILQVKKVGHVGTLDPNATGVLPVLLGEACKLATILKGLDKRYLGTMYVHKNVSKETLENIMEKFVGEIEQVPPVRSAVKRVPRKRKIYELKLLSYEKKYAKFYVHCEAGTYIRKLVADVGNEIGGAHLQALERLAVNGFEIEEAHTIEEVKKAYEKWKKEKSDEIREIVLPMEYALKNVKKVIVKSSAIKNIMNGAPLYHAGILRVEENIRKDDMVAMLAPNGAIIAIGIAQMNAKDMIKKRGLLVKTDRVIRGVELSEL